MRKLSVLLLLLLPATATFAKDNKPKVPKLITEARYVYVTTLYGDDIMDTRISVEDRHVIAAVEQDLREWGRYIITTRPEDADLLIVVRKGGYMKTQPGIRIGGDSQGNRRIGTTVGVDGGPPDDMLAVYDAHSGVEGSPLWRSMLPDGLGSGLPLLKTFRRAVESAATPPKPAKQN